MLVRITVITVVSAALTLFGMPVVSAEPPAAVPATVSEHLTGVPPQPTLPDVEAFAEASEADVSISQAVRTPIAFSVVGLVLPAGSSVELRTSTDGNAWTDWQGTEALDEEPDPGTAEAEAASSALHSAPVWVGEATHLQLRVTGGASTADVGVDLIDSMGLGRSVAARAADAVAAAWRGTPAPAAASVTAPNIVSRAQWGADETRRKGTPSAAANARVAVVHHTAGSNNYTPAQAAGQVRGIYAYHTGSLGWDDIGYNILIDRYGTVYEGRAGGLERAVIGAHAGGWNTGSFGVALMGQHHANARNAPAYAAATAASIDALVEVLAWKMDVHGIDGRGTVTLTSGGAASSRFPAGTTITVPTLVGHIRLSLTDCPGSSVINQFDTLRQRVADRQTRPSNSNAVVRVGAAASPSAASVLIGRAAFPAGGSAQHAVVARSDVFADAMTGGPLAGTGGPLLLTPSWGLDAGVRAELERVLPAGRTVYVLGGTAAMSNAVVSTLATRWKVVRLYGGERTATAAEVATRVRARSGTTTVMVARAGPDDSAPWADALAGGAYGARVGIPVLLTYPDRLMPATRDALRGVNRTLVLGGTAAISNSVMTQMPNPHRVSGGDRVGTSVRIAEQLWGRTSGSANDAILVGGGFQSSSWTLALAAAPLAAIRRSPLLLSSGTDLSPGTRQHLQRLGYGTARTAQGTVLGGTSAVSDRVLAELSGLLR